MYFVRIIFKLCPCHAEELIGPFICWNIRKSYEWINFVLALTDKLVDYFAGWYSIHSIRDSNSIGVIIIFYPSKSNWRTQE